MPYITSTMWSDIQTRMARLESIVKQVYPHLEVSATFGSIESKVDTLVEAIVVK